MPQHSMTKEDASKIQSSQAKGGQDMSSSGFSARAQSAGDKNANNNSGGGAAQSQGANAGNKGA